MIETQDLETLKNYQSNNHVVLSVYLDLDPSTDARRSYRTVLRTMLKDLENQTEDPAERKALAVEAEKVSRYMESQFTPHGRSVAIFSSTPGGLWQIHQLPVTLPSDVRLARTPYVKPLAQLMDEHERYCVVLVDKEKARIFTVFLGHIQEHEDILDDVPGKHKQGGWSQANFQRHHDTHVLWHLKRVVEALPNIAAEHPFDRLIIGGPEEATSEFVKLLPKSLADLMVGTFATPAISGTVDVLRETQAIEERAERKGDQNLVEEAITTASKGGPATVGIEDTLLALQERRVHKLIVAEDMEVAGYLCDSCGYLTINQTEICPACGGATSRIGDAVEAAVALALASEGELNAVRGPACDRLMEVGGMAAILRF